MKEVYHLVIQCCICWLHGFGTKTGGEQFIRYQAKKRKCQTTVGLSNEPDFQFSKTK